MDRAIEAEQKKIYIFYFKKYLQLDKIKLHAKNKWDLWSWKKDIKNSIKKYII